MVVIAVDVGAEGGVDATVTSNNRQAGQQAAQYIVDKLKGKGQIVIVNGPPVTAVQDRVAGAMDVFSKNPDIKILVPRSECRRQPRWGLARDDRSSDRISED